MQITIIPYVPPLAGGKVLSEASGPYCADGDLYELNAALESQQLGSKVFMDGGNEFDKYEVGSSLTLIASTGGSCEY